MSTNHNDQPPSESRRQWWHWRQLLRGQVRPLLAAGVAGALLGGTSMAWQTQSGPFGSDDLCWGALSRDDLAETFREPENVKAVEAPVLNSARSMDGPNGNCQLTNSDGDAWEFAARVHKLDSNSGDDGRWADEFLAARLTPLGGGLLGMASDQRAWLAIPDGCLGRPSKLDGPTVVDIAQSGQITDVEPDTKQRDALASMVVKLVNKVSADLGCAGTITDPIDRLPKAARYTRTEKGDALCGIKGLTWEKEKHRHDPMITDGRGPVRTCDRDISGSRPAERLMTVEDPRLAAIFTRMYLDQGERLRSAAGTGTISPNHGILQAQCQAGDTVFLVQLNDQGDTGKVHALFPRYVQAEAARLGCGPLKMQLPEPKAHR